MEGNVIVMFMRPLRASACVVAVRSASSSSPSVSVRMTPAWANRVSTAVSDVGRSAGSRATAEWTAEQGMNLMSSTLLTEDTGVPFHQLQAEQIQMFRDAWTEASHEREPRVSVSRSIFPIVNDTDRAYFGAESRSQDQVGFIDGGTARFGKTYAGEPDQLVKDLAEDEAIAAADTLLLTIPNQLGVDYNAHLLDSIVRYVAPELGWR